MEHKGTKTIETDRLILRKFCAEDINAAYANWTSDEKVTEFLRWRTPRFFIKPNLLQMHSSYVLTDPKGTVLPEVGNALLKNGYRIKIFNTINFKKSMHYNPFAYVHDEKDILKLVTTLIANTKGEGKSNDEFWESATC